MQPTSGQLTVPALQTLLEDGALAGEWVLDSRMSSMRVKTGLMGRLLPVQGVFRDLHGHGTVTAGGDFSGTLTVAASSVDTKNARRDTHLRSAAFLDTDNNPEISFTTNGLRPSGEGLAVTGALTIRGHTRPLSFDAAASVQNAGEVWLDAEVHINRRDFGITWSWAGMPSMNSTLTVHAVFTRQ